MDTFTYQKKIFTWYYTHMLAAIFYHCLFFRNIITTSSTHFQAAIFTLYILIIIQNQIEIKIKRE